MRTSDLGIIRWGPSGVCCGRLFAPRPYVGRASPLSVGGHLRLHVLARCVLLCLRLLRREALPLLGGWLLSAAEQAFEEHHSNPLIPVVTSLYHSLHRITPRTDTPRAKYCSTNVKAESGEAVGWEDPIRIYGSHTQSRLMRGQDQRPPMPEQWSPAPCMPGRWSGDAPPGSQVAGPGFRCSQCSPILRSCAV